MIKNLDLINECKKSSIEKACNHVKEFPFVKSMIIFGSSVRDDCTEESDVDICLKILSDVNGLDYYKMSGPLKNMVLVRIWVVRVTSPFYSAHSEV